MPRMFRPRVRWQIGLSFLLAAGVSVLLVAALGLAAANMFLRRSTVNLIQRQLELMVESAARVTESAAETVLAQSACPREADHLLQAVARTAAGGVASLSCDDGSRAPVVLSAPSTGVVESPSWLTSGSFRGVVVYEQHLYIFTLFRGSRQDVRVAVASRTPLDQELADLISHASNRDVDALRPMTVSAWLSGAAGEGLTSPGPGRLIDSWFGGEKPAAEAPMPVIVEAKEWTTGEADDWVAFRVRPDAAMTVGDFARLGGQQAPWRSVLAFLAGGLALLGLGSVFLAARIVHPILMTIDALTRGADQLARGELSYRIPVQRADELGVLSRSFNHMAESIERLMLETQGKARLEQEVKVARRVQESLLPKTIPRRPDVDLACRWEPARVVGGDFYDFVELEPDRLGLLCADISGKGIPAAILVAQLQAIVRGCIGPGRRAVGGASDATSRRSNLVEQVNTEFVRHVPQGSYATLFWAELDPATRLLRYVNAGHNPPLVIGPERTDVIRLDQGGVPVGLFPSASYAQGEIVLAPGSLLLVYTDGVSEATNAQGEEFGEERIIDMCQIHRESNAEAIIDSLFSALHGWSDGGEQFDDMTAVALKAS